MEIRLNLAAKKNDYFGCFEESRLKLMFFNG